MEIDIENETVLSLVDAARHVPAVAGRTPHTSTLWRWCRRGVRGVRLEYIRIGRRICTSQEALARFFKALAEADENPTISATSHCPAARKQSQKERARAIADADSSLEEAGM